MLFLAREGTSFVGIVFRSETAGTLSRSLLLTNLQSLLHLK